MDIAAKFDEGLEYEAFLDKYAKPEERRRWDQFHGQVALSEAQKDLLRGFQREMKVLVLAGTWCGDCVDQCPVFDRFAAESENIRVRFLDRDDHADLSEKLSICGGRRVPVVVFLSEDDRFCGLHGDRALAKYRKMASELSGAACPTGLIPPEENVTRQVVQEWLDEFERIQLMLRTSGRLREKHGD